MVRGLDSLEGRLLLLSRLRGLGLEVRMHGYEYFIRCKGRFACFLGLNPRERLAYLEGFRWNVDGYTECRMLVLEALKSLDSRVRVVERII